MFHVDNRKRECGMLTKQKGKSAQDRRQQCYCIGWKVSEVSIERCLEN